MSRTTPLRTKSVTPNMRAQARRTLLKAGGTLLISVLIPSLARAAKIMAVRIWPAKDYTRVTLENDIELKTSHFTVKDPERLVVDIEGLELNATLKDLVAKVQANDPYIKQVRVGQNRPKVVRLVFDLKEEVNPQVFTLQPVGSYQHRLVFDLYPANPPDPIAELIAKGEWSKEPGKDIAVIKPDVKIDTKPEVAASATAATPPTTPGATAEAEKNATKPGALVRMITIALDPGHGGEDPGAIGRGGNKEKDVVLAIAKRLKEKIEQQPNMRVMLTRDADYFVPLNVRVQKARNVQADLFLSIHADAFVESSARGSSVFVLSEKGASSTAARWLANKENAADLIGGVNIGNHDKQLASVLLDLSTTAQISDSLKLGKVVLSEIGGINRLHKGSVEQAGFAVLKAPDIPSILIETAFISNPEEEARLSDNDYQDKMADAVMKGIQKYFSKNPPLAKNKLV
jgi:N-acetylmuramoyl-L-alanine amidase